MADIYKVKKSSNNLWVDDIVKYEIFQYFIHEISILSYYPSCCPYGLWKQYLSLPNFFLLSLKILIWVNTVYERYI